MECEMGKPAIDLIGQRFGHWTVVERAENSAGKANAARWKCRCDCGSEAVVYSQSLRNGTSTRCLTCAGRATSERRTTHGEAKVESPTYLSWKAMKNRCQCKTSPDYPSYGGRGIRVCGRWNEFENFLEDMGSRPPGTSLDRLDGADDYYPENCRWATPMEQANNRRNNRIVEFDGESLTVAEFARKIGADRKMTRYWLVDKGMTPAEVITVTKSGGMATVSDATERGF
jgi:ribosomal protein S27E